MFKIGDIVKLKNYDSLPACNKNKIAIITEVREIDLVFKFINSNNIHIRNFDNFIKLKTYPINKLKDKLKVGDKIITNGDGSKKMSDWVYGEIGEIGTKDGKKCFYLWNNDKIGTIGTIQRPSKWRGSWLIYLDNKRGEIAFEREEKSIKSVHGVVCNSCGEFFKAETMERDNDGKMFCIECFNEKFVFCIECGIAIKKEDAHNFDGHDYCEECYDENVAECEACHSLFLRSGMCHSEIDDCDYCEECYDEEFTHCVNCETELSCHSDSCYHAESEVYCESCFTERFAFCSECSGVFRHDDLNSSDSGDLYCNDCWDSLSPESHTPTDPSLNQRLIHDYTYKPSLEFRKTKYDLYGIEYDKDNKNKVEKNLFIGLELEVQKNVEERKSSYELVKFLKEEGVEKYYYLKHDGSVPSGFEIVTHPFTLAYAHKEMKLQKILKWMKEQQFTSEESGKCGLHIHLSRNFFEDLDITKLRLFFHQNEKYLRLFSGRKGVGENYCMFESSLSIKQILNDYSQNGRYWALNLNSSTDTVEIRIFRGTLNAKRLISLLQFAEALSYFVKQIGATSIFLGEREYKKNSWKLFIDWAKEQGKYTTMINYLKGEELCV